MKDNISTYKNRLRKLSHKLKGITKDTNSLRNNIDSISHLSKEIKRIRKIIKTKLLKQNSKLLK